MNEAHARDEICRVGKSLFDRGYVHATAGNISVRLDASAGGGFLITPTDACLGFLQPERLAKLDSRGQHVSGNTPSKTIALHRRIYAAMDQVVSLLPAALPASCIIHTHSSHCVALSLAQTTAPGKAVESAELLPALTPYFVMKVGRVPLIPYERPGAPGAAERVARAIAAYSQRAIPLRAVMQERLGPVVWHSNPALAMAALEELEETAKLMHLAGPHTAALNADQIQELRQTFSAVW